MIKEFSFENAFSETVNLLKQKWLFLLQISIVNTIILVVLYYFLFQEIGSFVLDLAKDSSKIDSALILKMIGKVSIMIIIFPLISLFIDLIMIYSTSTWISGKEIPIDEIFSKVINNFLIALFSFICYIFLLFVSFSFCVFPIFLVIIYFNFLFQAIIIEEKGINSFGRSIEIVKSKTANIIVLIILSTIAIQTITSSLYFPAQFLISFFIPSEFEKSNPEEIVNFFLHSPAVIIGLVLFTLIYALQSNLKSIIMTVAYEQLRNDLNPKEIESKD